MLKISKRQLEKGPIEVAPGISIQKMGMSSEGPRYSVVVNGKPNIPSTTLLEAVQLVKLLLDTRRQDATFYTEPTPTPKRVEQAQQASTSK